LVQTVEAAPEYLAGTQLVQMVEAAPFAYLPASQSVQAVEAVPAAYLPAPQLVQAVTAPGMVHTSISAK
jgi:hypothetical protein